MLIASGHGTPPALQHPALPDAAWLPPHPVPGGASAAALGALPAMGSMGVSGIFCGDI